MLNVKIEKRRKVNKTHSYNPNMPNTCLGQRLKRCTVIQLKLKCQCKFLHKTPIKILFLRRNKSSLLNSKFMKNATEMKSTKGNDRPILHQQLV